MRYYAVYAYKWTDRTELWSNFRLTFYVISAAKGINSRTGVQHNVLLSKYYIIIEITQSLPNRSFEMRLILYVNFKTYDHYYHLNLNFDGL